MDDAYAFFCGSVPILCFCGVARRAGTEPWNLLLAGCIGVSLYMGLGPDSRKVAVCSKSS